MIYVIKRLSLGLLLIALASAILLVADLGKRTAGTAKQVRIALFQQVNNPPLDDGARGILDGLAEVGIVDGKDVAIERFNAQGDMATSAAIARQITAGGYDIIVTVSTPSAQAVANNNREGKTRHIFTIVADPFVLGLGFDRANPRKHPPHLVGQGAFPPVERAFQLARQAFPKLARVGVVWNPAESNSAAFVAKARSVAKEMGIELLEANVDNSSGVGEAAASLVGRDAQALWMGGDTSVNAAADQLISTAQRAGIPVFTSLPGKPDRGTLFDMGPDFYQVGKVASELVAEAVKGGDFTNIPIRDVLDLVPAFLNVNLTALAGLHDNWTLPDGIVKDASVVVDAAGIHRKAAPGQARSRPLFRKWNVAFIELNSVLDMEEAEKGVFAGFTESGIVRGRDYEATVLNAQGDMATLSGMVDASLSGGANMIVTFSTPALQAAMQRTKDVPIVFNYVASAVAAGAGTSDTDHVPNVTGVYMISAFDTMLGHIRAIMPKVKTLGLVYVPAEVNMVVQRDGFMKSAKKAGIEVKAVAANSASEVADAALALTSSGIDAICQIPGNLTVAAFPSIAHAAKQARMPIFVFQSGQVKGGAVLAVARDYYDSGREAAKLAARVMRGETPASIPLLPFAKTRQIVNLDAARELRLAIPQAITARADEVIGK